MNKRVNIQFKGHLVSFGYSERIYELCGSNFFLMLSYGQYDKLRKINNPISPTNIFYSTCNVPEYINVYINAMSLNI